MSGQAMMEMPKYNCHKKVWALKISEVEITDSDGGGFLKFEDERFSNRDMSSEFMTKHKPKSGGYFVVYEDGYNSFSPKDVFEDGYKEANDFSKISNDSAVINEMEREILNIIDKSAVNIPLVTTYGVLSLIAQDLLNKASMARIMITGGADDE